MGGIDTHLAAGFPATLADLLGLTGLEIMTLYAENRSNRARACPRPLATGMPLSPHAVGAAQSKDKWRSRQHAKYSLSFANGRERSSCSSRAAVTKFELDRLAPKPTELPAQ